MNVETSSILTYLVFYGSLFVFFVAVTSYLKITIVFAILRNALGLQQFPSNIIINTFAIILTIIIMGPQLTQIAKNFNAANFKKQDIGATVYEIYQPVKGFMEKNADPQAIKYFDTLIKERIPLEKAEGKYIDFFKLVPAFMISELTSAFESGVFIYLPFLVIDIVISNILIALGMVMVSPVSFSLPIKLLLFVLIGGWELITSALVHSYII